jgi:hypothetical protein
MDHVSVAIESLRPEEIEAIFKARLEYLEEHYPAPLHPFSPASFTFEQAGPLPAEQGAKNADIPSPLRFGIGAFDHLGMAMQHNPELADSPPLPEEMLEKISAIARMLSPQEILQMPKAEPHCNCFYCQITRAVQGPFPVENNEEEIEESVDDKELSFSEWDIQQTGDRLFSVSNKLDANEQYRVFLGEPVGCTCGKNGCEHILAVLKS